MIAFVDTSVVLRLLLGEPHPLAEWGRFHQAFASRLLPVEIARVLDRYHLGGVLDEAGRPGSALNRGIAAVVKVDVGGHSPKRGPEVLCPGRWEERPPPCPSPALVVV